jgi:hypothetical protein
MKWNTLLCKYGPFAARKRVVGTEMNEKGYFQICHRERFRLQIKMHVWQPGSSRTRWGSLNAPQDTIAAVGAMEDNTLQSELGCIAARKRGRVEVRGRGGD